MCVCSGTIRDGMEPVWGTLYYVLNSKPFVPCRVHSGKRSKQQWLSGTIFPFRVILFLLPRSGHTVRWCGCNDAVRVLCRRIACPRIVPSPHLYRSNILRTQSHHLINIKFIMYGIFTEQIIKYTDLWDLCVSYKLYKST